MSTGLLLFLLQVNPQKKENGMISEACDLAEFFRKVETRDVLDVIYTAEQEATSAERSLYHPRRCGEAERKACREYVEALKSLIGYLRYNVRPPISEAWLAYFQHAETELERYRRSPAGPPRA